MGMKKYKELSEKEFKRLTGVKRKTFETMEKVVENAEKTKKERGGAPNKLDIEERLLMWLEYMREYRTYFHVGQSWGISESACYRNCVWIEDVLIKSKVFSLPGKKALLKPGNYEVVLIDATESPIERPKKK